MKLSALLFLVFYSLATYAQSGFGTGMGMYSGKPPEAFNPEDHPEITVKFNKKTATCSLDKISKLYLCPNGNDPVLVKHSPFGFSALGSNKKNTPTIINITNVEEKGKNIFSRPDFGGGFPGIGMGMGTSTSEEQVEVEQPTNLAFQSIKLNVVDEFLTKTNFVNGSFVKERINTSPEVQKVADTFMEQRKELETTIQIAYSEKTYALEMDDGQKINCQRGSVKTLSPEMKKIQDSLGQTLKCGTFKCDPVTIDGKTYDATMLFDSNQTALIPGSVHLTNKDGLGPQRKIKKIFSPNSSIPLVDNSSMLAYGGGYTGEMSYASLFPSSLKSQDRDKLSIYKDPSFDQILEWYKQVCDDKTELDKISDAKKILLQKLADSDLAEFIQVLSNGSLVGTFIDPAYAAELGCLYQGVYLNEEAEKNLSRIKKNIFPDKVVTQTISPDKAKALFNKAAGMKDIAWKYNRDGCYARAHLMARRFEEEGVRVDKVWIKGDLFVEGTPIRWNFHVAPIVYVEKENGKIEKMVIDPSLFDKPVTVEEWDKKMSKKTMRGSVVTAFPFPENAALMERSSLSFSSSDPYLPTEDINMTEQQKMDAANMTMKMYKAVEPK